MKNLILIDFSWLYNRYYFVASQRVEEGLVARETLSMLSQFLKLIESSYKSAKVIAALDSPTSSLINFSICPFYKQNRDKEGKKKVYKDLDWIVKELISELNPKSFAFIREKGYEADQIIAYIIKKYHDKCKMIIYSGDKDLLQLTYYKSVRVSDKFKDGKFLLKKDEEIFDKFKNSKGESFTRISTSKRDILKYRVLKGDTSDNLSPVFPRIKDKEIIDIVKNYWIDEEELTEVRVNDIIDDIRGDNPLLAEKLEENADNWIRNYKIMSLFDINLEEMKLKRLK